MVKAKTMQVSEKASIAMQWMSLKKHIAGVIDFVVDFWTDSCQMIGMVLCHLWTYELMNQIRSHMSVI